MKEHPWLHYSQFVDGAFCRACALFAPNPVGGQDLGKFVTSPFKSWTKMSVIARASKEYHHSSMTKMREFLVRYQNPGHSVGTLRYTGNVDQSEGDRIFVQGSHSLWEARPSYAWSTRRQDSMGR